MQKVMLSKKLRYMSLKFKIDSFFSIRGIPIRYICLILAIVTFAFYFMFGKTLSKYYVTPISGIVKKYDINYQNQTGNLTLNIELNNNDTILIQNYYIDIPAKTIFSINGNQLKNMSIPLNSKVVSYYNKHDINAKDTQSDRIKLKTYGLRVADIEIIDIDNVGFLTFKVSIWGTLSFLLILVSFLLFIIDTFVLPKRTQSDSTNISNINK